VFEVLALFALAVLAGAVVVELVTVVELPLGAVLVVLVVFVVVAVLAGTVATFVFALLAVALVAVLFAGVVPPQAKPSAAKAKTDVSAITFFISKSKLLSSSKNKIIYIY